MNKKFLFSLLLICIAGSIAFYGCGDNNVVSVPTPAATATTSPGNGVVAGQALDNAGNPIANATVEYTELAAAEGGDVSASQVDVGITDNNGFFNFQHRPGNGTIRIFDSGNVFFNNVPLDIQREGFTLITFPSCQQTFFFLHQLSFNLDGNVTNNSDWGSVTMELPGGSTGVRYFNMRVGDNWVARNLPVPPDSFFDITYRVDFENAPGTAINNIQAFPLLSDEPLETAPPVIYILPVGQDNVIFNSGLFDFPIELFTPGILNGGPAQNANSAGLKNYDSSTQNQEAGENECVPVAASNSLKYLDANSDKDISATSSIQNMKDATGWTAEGCGVDWADSKNNYMGAHNHPVSTTNTTSFETALQAIKDGKDVELSGGWHAAMVVGITKMDDGKWAVGIAHDTKQGEAGGTKIETIIYDPATGKFSGSPGFFDGSIFRFFTIEAII